MPFDITEADRQMAHCKPDKSFKKKSKKIDGTQHVFAGKEIGGDSYEVEETQYYETGNNAKYTCFKCGHFKPDCYEARTCRFEKKLDGSDASKQETIDKKISELYAAKKLSAKKKEVDRSSSFINSSIVPEDTIIPDWEDKMVEEKSRDRNLIHDYSFN